MPSIYSASFVSGFIVVRFTIQPAAPNCVGIDCATPNTLLQSLRTLAFGGRFLYESLPSYRGLEFYNWTGITLLQASTYCYNLLHFAAIYYSLLRIVYCSLGDVTCICLGPYPVEMHSRCFDRCNINLNDIY